ncbi:DUF5666 domain-containing protein [Actinomadura meridiana]
MRINRITLVSGASAVSLLGLGIGLYVAVPAAAADPSPTPKASSSTSAHPRKAHPRKGEWGKGHPHLRARPFRGVHGEATVRRKDGFHTTAWQHGKITAMTSNTVTVRSDDGVSWAWTSNGDTRVRKNNEKSALKALATGDQVLVFGEQSGTTRTARLIRVPKPR